jgi:hypothetical protein
VTLSPALNVRLVQPLRVSTPGLDISMDQVFGSAPFCGLASTTVSWQCGLIQRK